MVHGYGHVKTLCAELQDFMRQHNFSTIEDFRGYVQLIFLIFLLLFLLLLTCFLAHLLSSRDRHSLQYFTTHTDLVRRQKEAIEQRKAERKGLKSDKDWTGDGFVKETESMVSN